LRNLRLNKSELTGKNTRLSASQTVALSASGKPDACFRPGYDTRFGFAFVAGKALWQYNTPTLIDNRIRPVGTSSQTEHLDLIDSCAADLDDMYDRCAETYPGFGVSNSQFREAVLGAIDKYLFSLAQRRAKPTPNEISQFIRELRNLDLYLSLACAHGNEQAWWLFDRQYRSFIERIARHLARNGMDADEVIESVYIELFGTRIVGEERQSKFRTYTGRGTLRGWLRTIIWHTVVDLYRRKRDEIGLEDWSAAHETEERPTRRAKSEASEELMMTHVMRERYRSFAIAALDQSLATLDEHETLLLLYYHVEGLKLREIARLVEEPASPIRRWFQQQSKRLANSPRSRVHESTVMRWLEKVYRKVSDCFRAELAAKHGLNTEEIDICVAIATEDLGQGVRLNQTGASNQNAGS